MKILRLLNKKIFLLIFLTMPFGLNGYSDEKPVDIWNSENQKEIEINVNDNNQTSLEPNDEGSSKVEVFNIETSKNINIVEFDDSLNSKKSKVFGLYDPEDHDLDLDMWLSSDGNQLENIFSKLKRLELSDDANEIMKIALLTNAHVPQKNISEEKFLKFRSEWLIKNSNLNLIEEYLIKNQIINLHPKLTRHLIDHHLSEANLEKACKIFLKNSKPIIDDYLSKFSIYCLINNEKNEEAQLILDLKKELGFEEKYFEDKINFLLGYTSKADNEISEKSIFDFHLAHRTNPDFKFEPNNDTSKKIWKYLSSTNLLGSLKQIEISDLDKIKTLEKATHNKNYPEKDLLEIYKQFQFNINQLINADQSHKSLSGIEARALIYQKVLLESEISNKLKYLKILKNLFKKENLNNAFDDELKNFLSKINPTDVPDNLTSFYYTNIEIKKDVTASIKFNKDLLHQSKLLNYFNGDYSKSKIEKDVDNFLKKIKKDKKYFFSKKDQIFIESLKYDGIEISKKYDDLYEVNDTEIPTDIQVMINNNEKGAALLRIAEVIGQDKLERIDEDTIYFIIMTLNQLNIDLIRNKILLKVLPLKV